MNWIKKLFGFKNKNTITNIFYCEIENDPRHNKCKEQCNHCKEEWNKMINI